MKYLVLTLALAIGPWLLFDGSRALITGNYTTPSSGPYAGKLGPWSRVVSSVGLNPLGTTVKLLHVLLGVSWVACSLLLLREGAAMWWPMMLTALFTLWYVPFGAIAGAAVAGLLLLPSMR
jgi:hypothetical protein